MAHPTPHRLIPTAAREAHTALVAALGTTHIPQQWMIFMETVTAYLPDILSTGRPTAASIRQSVIGMHGFTSWRQMIEAATEQGGLGWNYSTWKAYRRAWGYVGEYPWLRNEALIYSEVIRLGLLLDKSKQTPDNMDEALAIAAEIKSEATAKGVRESNLDSDPSRPEYDRVARGRTARRIRDLRNRRSSLTRQLRVLDDRAHHLEQELADQGQRSADRERELKAALSLAENQARLAQMRVTGYQEMPFWQRLKAVFSGY